MENLEEKTEVLDGAGESAESQNNLELNDIKGNNITIEDAKATLTHNSDLIQGAINGESKAFNELYLQSYRYVFFVIRQYISDDETTYDAIQETFIKVYKNIGSLREPASYYGWLTSVAKNTAIDILRTKPSETELVYEEKNDATLKDEQTNKDVSLDIETVLKKLDPQDADLLSLVYYDGMRISQIAKMQGVPKTTVYSRFNKAKKNLKAQLKVHGIDKAIYSGNFVAMITTAIRNIIGTALLSFAIAQQILNSVIGKKSKKELAVAKIIQQHQKKMALKIASCLVAICMIVSCFTILAITDWGRSFTKNVGTAVKEIITGNNYYDESVSGSTIENSTSQHNQVSSGSFWQNLFGKTDDESNIESTQSGNSLGNILDFDNNAQNQTESDNGTSSENNTHQNENSAPDNTNTDDASSVQSGVSSINGTSSANSSNSNNSQVSSVFNPPTIPSNFVPDCNSSQYNIIGNLAHNTTLHYGKVARQGDWIYYAAESDEHWLKTNLYKVKTGGTKKQTLVENICSLPCINVVGEWIYFIGGHALSEYYLARVRTDGTGYQQLTDFKIEALQVVGNTAYFRRLSSGEYGDYCKMNLKTGEITVLVNNVKDAFVCVTNKYFLYRPDGIDGNLRIYDNKTGALVHDFKSRGIQVYNNKVLVHDTDGVALYDLDNLSAKPVKLSKYISSPFESVNYLFYSPYKGGVICDQIKTTDGNDDIGILTLSNFGFKAWPFDWTHANANDFTSYSTFDDGYVYCVIDKVLYRCLPDGSNLMVY